MSKEEKELEESFNKVLEDIKKLKDTLQDNPSQNKAGIDLLYEYHDLIIQQKVIINKMAEDIAEYGELTGFNRRSLDHFVDEHEKEYKEDSAKIITQFYEERYNIN